MEGGRHGHGRAAFGKQGAEGRGETHGERRRLSKIGVLARSLGTFRGGVDGYLDAIIRHGAPLARERGHRVVVYVDDAEVARRYESMPCELVVVPMGPLGRIWWDHAAGVRRAEADAIDVLLCPRSFRPLHVSSASVTIVYDLMYFDARASLLPLDHGAYFRALMRRSLHRSQAIAVFSTFTRERLLANLPDVRAEQVRVLPPGTPDPAFRPLAAREISHVLARLGVRSPYAIAVGIHPRKNTDVLIRSLAHVDPEFQLVLVAGAADAKRIAALERIAREAGVVARVRILPRVAQADLVALYGGAAVTVYASRYEGIGLPPLEAMACGCPVVATAAGAIPEVVCDAAAMVPVGDEHALGAAVERVTKDGALAAELRRNGLARVASFDWAATARALLDVLEAAAV